jgi:hypothetical protein
MPEVLYDVCAEGAPIAGDIRGALAGALLGVLLLAVVWKRPDRGPRLLALLFTAAWIGRSAWNVLADVRAHRTACETLRTGRAALAEGEVTDFSAMPADRGGYETFRVGGVLFKMRPGRGPGLSRIAEKGGPIRSGRKLRVTYAGDAILKVEEILGR